MDDVTQRLREKANRSRDVFVSQRAILEQEIAKFAEGLKNVDPSLVAHIELPEGGLTAKTLFPSLYEENVDIDKYNSDRQKVISIFKQYDAVRASLVAKAEAILNG